MKFKLKDAFKFSWKGLKGWVYNSKEDFSNASAVYFKVTGSHGRVKTLISDRVYLVLKGRGHFIINKEVIPVKKTDVIIVPKNTPYDYKGKMELFLVHVPAFDQKKEIKLG
mgnify:CR=1 FL=1